MNLDRRKQKKERGARTKHARELSKGTSSPAAPKATQNPATPAIDARPEVFLSALHDGPRLIGEQAGCRVGSLQERPSPSVSRILARRTG